MGLNRFIPLGDVEVEFGGSVKEGLTPFLVRNGRKDLGITAVVTKGACLQADGSLLPSFLSKIKGMELVDRGLTVNAGEKTGQYLSMPTTEIIKTMKNDVEPCRSCSYKSECPLFMAAGSGH